MRVITSFIPTPFCTAIGLIVYVIYQLISTNYYISKNKLNMEMREENIRRKHNWLKKLKNISIYAIIKFEKIDIVGLYQ